MSKTLDDIVANLRARAQNMKEAAKQINWERMQHEECRVHPHCHRQTDLLREASDTLALADDIEAAAKREREKTVAQDATVSGNAAAMREALRACLDFIMRLDRAFNPLMQNLLENAIAKAQAALSAPPRNCDVGMAVEQAERFKAFCLPRVGKCSENSSCPAKHPCNHIGIQYCQLKWAQLPYETAKEGGAE